MLGRYSLLLLTLALAWVAVSTTEAAGRHQIFTSRPKQYASKYIAAIEPLQGFKITHSDGKVPLAGFHPEAPAVAKPQPKPQSTTNNKKKTNKKVNKNENQPLTASIVENNAGDAEDPYIQTVVTEGGITSSFSYDDNNATSSEDPTSTTPVTEEDDDDAAASAEEEEDMEEDEPRFTENDLDHWTVYGAPHSYHKGQAQLFPDTIQLEIQAFGQTIELELFIIKDLFDEHSRVEVWDENGVVSKHRHVMQSYWAHNPNAGEWATATLHRDGRFQATIHKDGDTIQIDPVEIHQQSMTEIAYSRLHKASHSPRTYHENCAKGMAVHRHSDVDYGDSHLCASKSVGGEQDPIDREEYLNSTISQMTTEPLQPYLSTSRRLLQAMATGYGNFPTTSAGIVGWTSCYYGDTNPQRFAIGFAVDAGMYNVWQSVSGVQQYVAWQMSVSNIVYLAQLHAFLTISDTLVMTALGGTTPSWNDQPPSPGLHCTIDIQTKLNTLSAWRNSANPTRNTVWQLQTNCYPPSGVVGLAWVGTLCNNYYGTSISTYSTNQWLTSAHELGHNFGASHTFQLGVGSTGGIMDYGNGQLNGIFQFNTQYSQSAMCSALQSTQSVKGFSPYCATSYVASCGNGVIEPGETCDDKSSCCGQPGSTSPCKLTSSAQCSGETPCCSQCKFLPSSTTCLGGTGYCQNGFCAVSACTGYSGLTYCGTEPANACRQRCMSSGTCSSSYSSPNVNVPDGVVCATTPYSTCVSGVCTQSGTSTAPVVTYSWSTSDWSTCTCASTQGRTTYCLGSDGSVGTAGVQCSLASQPTTSQSCTAPASCVTYSWSRSAWGTCSVDCGSGVQTATVQCISSGTNAAVATSYCSGTQPASTQSCNTGSCPSQYVYSAWSACSVGCGSGVSTRTFSCQMTQNGVTSTVSNSYCTGLQATSQACNTQACTAPTPTVTYSLTYGAWGTCSVTCGAGSQSRPAYCLGSDGKTYATSYCGCGAGTSTATCSSTIQACNTQACPTYSWTSGTWGTCSVTCGGGTQTRTVTCKNDATAGAVANTFCTTAQPSGIQSCNTNTCPVYKWTSGLWNPCDKKCGGGIQTRAVQCVDGNNVIVTSTNCATATKPLTSQSCNIQKCGAAAMFVVGAWTTCSAWCGGGVQYRSVKCVNSNSLTPIAYTNCDTTNIPASAQYCNTGVTCPLNSDVQWVLSNWTDCSTICGGDGVMNRTVICTNSTTGAEVDPKYCPSDYRPEVSSSCGDITCPTFWYTSPWSSCSANCGGGSQQRTIECRYVNGGDQSIDEDQCTAGTRPSEQADCNIQPCPQWVPGDWGNCSTRCGDGSQTRTMSCITWDNQNTTTDQCNYSPIPATTQVCSNQPCPHWHMGPWSYCDAPCGGGNQTRSLVCRMPHDDTYHGQIAADDTLCPPVGSGDTGDGVGDPDVIAGKPASWQVCDTLPCPTYYWDVVKWSDCSQSCGSGSQTGTAVCRPATDKTQIVENNLCLGDPPATTRVCNVDPCPVYNWVAFDDWGNCSVVCGSGVQTRTVVCANTNPADWKHITFEMTQDDTLCSSIPKLPTVQVCAFDKSVCFGNGGNANAIANGLCTTDGTCLCRAGYSGTFCDQNPTVTDVFSNGASFTSGIAFGDTLQVQWKFTGVLPYVSILLVRSAAANSSENWQVPAYIARDIINSGSFQWTVGNDFPDLESGDGYKVRVWFSDRIWAENAVAFTVADPCAYKSCGIHGTCGVGGVCECVTGYSGDTCAVGPCERAHCSTSYGSCNNDDYIGLPTTDENTVGICKCGQNANGYFDGLQCRTPPGCTPKCQNGADLFNVIIDLNGKTDQSKGQCGTCGCLNRWGGDDCSICGIKCYNGGAPDVNCTKCDCTNARGYFGSTCACKYYEMELKLNLGTAVLGTGDWLNDPIASERFARTLAIDLALAAGQVTGVNVQINVEGVSLDPTTPGAVLAELQFGLECPTLSEEISGGSGTMMSTPAARKLRASAFSADSQSFNNMLSPNTVRSLNAVYFPLLAWIEVSGTTGPSTGVVPTTIVYDGGLPTLLSVYNVMATSFEDLSSPVYRGVVTSALTLAAVTKVADLTGSTQPTVPGTATDPFQSQQADSGQPGGFLPPGQVETYSGGGNKLGTATIIGIVCACVAGVCCMFVIGYLIWLSRGPRVEGFKPTLASQRQRTEGGTELQSSQQTTPADTPHTTPPQPVRTLQASPPPSRSPPVRSPSADVKYTVTSTSNEDYI